MLIQRWNDVLLSPESLPRQGFGAMRLRDGTSGDPDRDPVAVIHRALDAGVAMIDTADAYATRPSSGGPSRPAATR